jgi:hypothetical protein
MPLVGFQPTTPAGERPQTYALQGAATGTGLCNLCGSYVIHYDQINWRLQQISNASVALSSVLPDGLRFSLMLSGNLHTTVSE